MKRWILALAAALLALCPAVAAQPGDESATRDVPAEDVLLPEAKTGEDWLLLAENGGVRLRMDPATTNFMLETGGGERLASFPSGAEDDAVAAAGVRGNMQSLLVVEYMDEQNNLFTVSSLAGSVRRQSYAIKKMRSNTGAVVEFNFTREKEQFMLPLRLTLEDGILRAEVQFHLLEERGTARVASVRLLPYLMAGNADDDGYVIVPDGSGMAIDFDAAVPGTYEARVYGEDGALTKRSQIGRQEAARMPVAGMVRGEIGLLGIIEQADAFASIRAQAPGTDSTYASVCPVFQYRQSDISVLADSAWNEREVIVVSDRVTGVNPVVSYHIVQGPQAQPAGLAAIYRQYLLDNQLAAPSADMQAFPAVFEVFGAVKKAGSFLGIPTSRTVTATTAGQVEEMIGAFRERGVEDAVWTLYGFEKGGLYGSRLAETDIDRAVGGNRAYRALLETAGDQGARVLPAVDLLNLYRQSGDAVKQLNNDLAYQYPFKRNVPARDKSTHWLLLKPDKMTRAAIDYLKGYDRRPAGGITLAAAGELLYSDFDKARYADREEVRQSLEAMAGQLKAGAGRLAVTGGNAYIWRHAGLLLDVPAGSSGYEYESRELPFFQIALHGVLPMAAPPVNVLDGGRETARLKNMEAGLLPAYRLTGDSPAVYQDTRLNFLFNTAYANWLEEAAGHYRELSGVHQPLQTQVITDYAWQDGMRRVTYENGVILYVNYSSREGTYDGRTIPARGYAVHQGNEGMQ